MKTISTLAKVAIIAATLITTSNAKYMCWYYDGAKMCGNQMEYDHYKMKALGDAQLGDHLKKNYSSEVQAVNNLAAGVNATAKIKMLQVAQEATVDRMIHLKRSVVASGRHSFTKREQRIAYGYIRTMEKQIRQINKIAYGVRGPDRRDMLKLVRKYKVEMTDGLIPRLKRIIRKNRF